MKYQRAVTSEAITRCREFWYQVYVTEMSRHDDKDSYVDAERNSLRDAHDESGHLIYAEEKGTIVGTVLTTDGRDVRAFHYYDEIYKLPRSTQDRATISITNKLIVSQLHRRSVVTIRLAQATYRDALFRGIRQNYIDCNPPLVPFFERLGYVKNLGWIEHKDYGKTWSMVLNLDDYQHLKRIRSPLLVEPILRCITPKIQLPAKARQSL